MSAEVATTTIAQRIAALKLQEVRGPPPPSYEQATAIKGKRAPPPLPNRGGPDLKRQTSAISSLNGASNGASHTHERGNQPAGDQTNGHRPAPHGSGIISPKDSAHLPSRPANKAPPALPARRPTDKEPPRLPARQPSNTPTFGQVNRVKAPSFDASALPPLPPKRPSEEQRPSVPTSHSTSSLTSEDQAPSMPALPARNSMQRPAPDTAQRQIEPPPRVKRSALSMGFGNKDPQPPPVPSARPGSVPPSGDTPPPVPKASRPDLAALQASKPKPSSTSTPSTTSAPAPAPSSGACLKCRDFSAPDTHAARFPRESLPSHDLSFLASSLCTPFPSPTDKARAIFSWLHHNISYDTQAFFSKNLKPSTPATTMASGWAVCEGYAALFSALALNAGLECYLVGGHGKGYGYEPTAPGAPVPAEDATGHAWNAVRIDDGKWKLIDSCWGAGHICGANNLYKKAFSPVHFVADNVDFGERHFPSDGKSFFREDGRPAITWEEYIRGPEGGGEGPKTFGGFSSEEGVDEKSFRPRRKEIGIAEERGKGVVRFQFNKICEHWDPHRNGKGEYYCYVLELSGSKKKVPFETNGFFWWVDVRAEDLGPPGGQVKICAITKFDNKDGRGLTAKQFREKDGRVSAGWGYVAEWDLEP